MPTWWRQCSQIFTDHTGQLYCFEISDVSRCKESRSWCIMSLACRIATWWRWLQIVYHSPLNKFRWLFIPNSLAKRLRNDTDIALLFSCVLKTTRIDESWLCLCCFSICGWILSHHFQALNAIFFFICWPMNGKTLLIFVLCLWVDQNILLRAILKAFLLGEIHHSGSRLWWN